MNSISCPAHQYLDTTIRDCLNCPSVCNSCLGPLDSDCSSCRMDEYMLAPSEISTRFRCVKSCSQTSKSLEGKHYRFCPMNSSSIDFSLNSTTQGFMFSIYLSVILLITSLLLTVSTIIFVIYYIKKKEKNFNSRSHELELVSLNNSDKPKLESIPISDLDWDNKKQIGKGQFGCVYRCYYKGKNEDVAVKELNNNGTMANIKFLQEMGLLSELRHPNVMRIIGINHKNKLKIITPLRESDLGTYLIKCKKLDAKDLIRFCVQITDAMVYLHSKNIIHCDLKANNILVKDEFTVEVADFGLATNEDNNNMIGGTLTHMPLEYLRKEVKRPTKEGDVWSFGVTAWQIFTYCREKPYNEYNITSVNKMIEVLFSGTRLSAPQSFSSIPFLWTTVLSCFSEDPSKRPTFEYLYSKFARAIPVYSSPENFNQTFQTTDGF